MPTPRVRPALALPPPPVHALPVPNRGMRDYHRRLEHHFKTSTIYRHRAAPFAYGGGGSVSVRASQIVAEALNHNPSGAHASQVTVEVLNLDPAGVHASQIIAEALFQQRNPQYVRASQIVLEILIPNLEPPELPIYPNLIGLTPLVTKRPKWSTGTGVASSGREIRVGYWSRPQWEWDLAYDILGDSSAWVGTTASDLKTLIGFLNFNYGSLQPFLFQDPDDYAVVGQALGTGDSLTSQFIIQRTFGCDGFTSTEPVGQVNVNEPINVYVNGALQSVTTDYTISTATPCGNYIQFVTNPPTGAAITADFQFYYYCRFADDSYDFEKFMKNLWNTKKITIFSLKG